MVKIRQRFNEGIKEYGNKVMFRKDYGLGDLLTEEVNFSRASAVIGGLMGVSIGIPFIPYSLLEAAVYPRAFEGPVSISVRGILRPLVTPAYYGGKFGNYFGKKVDGYLKELIKNKK